MEKTTWNPGTLLQTSGSYWQACTLHAGVKLGIFSALAECSLGPDRLSALMQVDKRGLTMLLDALTAMGLLVKDADVYDLTGVTRRFLVKSSPKYIGHMILHHHHLVSSWVKMDEAVKSGQPVRTAVGKEDDSYREAFLMGMYNIASQQAPDIALQISIEGDKRLLDLGGGPGTYAIHFCLHNPQMSAVVFDLHTTQPFAQKIIDQHGLADRVDFAAGDYLKDDLPGRFDVVWLSHILHAEGPDKCSMLLKKAVAVLNPGGLIIVHDFILDNSMDGPLFPALFALNMLQATTSGQSYSESQLYDMMAKAGLADIQRLAYCGPTESGIMKGVKKY